METSLGQSPWNAATHPIFYIDPGTQLSSDFSSGSSFLGYPTVPLIDLATMTVIVDDCWDYPSAGAADFEACVADNL
jgi:hypothetical protein